MTEPGCCHGNLRTRDNHWARNLVSGKGEMFFEGLLWLNIWGRIKFFNSNVDIQSCVISFDGKKKSFEIWKPGLLIKLFSFLCIYVPQSPLMHKCINSQQSSCSSLHDLFLLDCQSWSLSERLQQNIMRE